jgi:hypothetical protein
MFLVKINETINCNERQLIVSTLNNLFVLIIQNICCTDAIFFTINLFH